MCGYEHATEVCTTPRLIQIVGSNMVMPSDTSKMTKADSLPWGRDRPENVQEANKIYYEKLRKSKTKWIPIAMVRFHLWEVMM